MYKYNYKKEKIRLLRKNQTETEKIIWEILRNRKIMGIKFRRQYPIGEYIVDFYSVKSKLVIEIDGMWHYTEERIEYDKIRTKYIACKGIKVIRFSNKEILENIEKVINEIKIHLTPDPSPRLVEGRR